MAAAVKWIVRSQTKQEKNVLSKELRKKEVESWNLRKKNWYSVLLLTFKQSLSILSARKLMEL